MQKDVIYIDTEDDITAIIGKVKDAKEKIVALVPPKRVGVIQSAVNLKLVHRAAEQADKRLVIISSNPALMALASSTGIPTAKNLQSRPEMAEVPALDIDDGEDVIDGSDMPSESPSVEPEAVADVADDAPASAMGAAALDATEKKTSEEGATVSSAAPVAAAAASKKRTGLAGKVPDFNSFRKKLILIIVAVAALIGLLVWAIVFAPTARIIITANTSDSALSSKVTLDSAGQTSLKDGVIKTAVKSSKKDVSIPITATGKKDVGDKARGVVTFTVASMDVFRNGATIPAGTTLTSSGGSTYTTDGEVVLPGNDSIGAWLSGQRPSRSVGVTASAAGASSNGATGPAGGAPSGVSAVFTTATSGGTDKTVPVVTQDDVDRASGDVVKQPEIEEARKALSSQFGNEYIVIVDSFKSDSGDVKPNPGVDQEVSDGKATLAGSVVYSLAAVPKKEAGAFLDQYFAQQIDGKADRRVYGNGLEELAFTSVSETGGKYVATMTTNGKIGPKINEQAIKEYARGKKYGEIKEKIEEIDGVDTVDVKFSPFWVSRAPGDVKKINFEFKVTNAD